MMMDDNISDSKSKSKSSWYRRAHIRWELLPLSVRRTSIISAFFIVFYISVTLVDVLVRRPQPMRINSIDSSPYNNFTVVINTYQRPAQLRSAVRHYATTCGPHFGVDHVYIVWAEEGVEPPSFAGQHDVPVTVQKVRNSLNSRFLPIPGVNGAVFMVDDDLLVRCSSLRTAFTAWQTVPMALVGFYPRLANAGVYHCWPMVYWRQRMNMILTKACFLHATYLQLYSTVQPAAIRDHVDTHFNCEDVAMALLVANATTASSNTAPSMLYVEGSVHDRGLFHGISAGSGHMEARSDCVRTMTQVYRDHGWPAPLDYSVPLREATYIQHLFPWQTRPSNIFEWFALANVFQ